MVKNNQTLGIIPARYASTRFPGKPLVDISGKSMIRRVYEQASKSSSLDAVVVATDDERIFSHVQTFGRVVMTSAFHNTGTDRCAEVAELSEFSGYQYIVNIQGDEPFVKPQQLDQLVSVLKGDGEPQIATLVKQVHDFEDLNNPNVVKVVFGKDGKAIYFSRSPIPFVRNFEPMDWTNQYPFYKHIGIYAFQRSVLMKVAKLASGNLEKAESLEQLRWLENGLDIGIGVTSFETQGIDTPEDLDRIKQ